MTPSPTTEQAPKPALMLVGPKGELARVLVGPGLELVNTPEGIMLRAPRPLTATVTNAIARRAEDGSYPLPEAVKGATPKQVAHLVVYRTCGIRLRPLVDYTTIFDEAGNRIRVKDSIEAELIVDYVATY